MIQRLRKLFGTLGSGLISGASNDDPSAIGTYVVAGASFGFATLWTALFTLPLIAVIQYLCAKIGMVSGRGMVSVLRHHYSRKLLYSVVLLFSIANLLNAGADIAAVAAGLNLFIPVPTPVLAIPIGIGILVLQIWGSYHLLMRIFKWLVLALLAYIVAAVMLPMDIGAVITNTFIPTLNLDSSFVLTLVAILGTRLSPYLFIWQADQSVEEEVMMGRRTLRQRRGATSGELHRTALDVNVGMFFSNLVMYFIILTTAATLFQAGETDVESAAQAAEALRPLAGDAARVLFGVGLIGSGLLAVPVMTTGVAYAVSELFGWRYGLNEKPQRARRFYLVITAATIIGIIINFLGINPINLLVWSAALNGILAPLLLVVILHMSNNKAVIGERTNGRSLNVLGIVALIVMTIAAGALFITWIGG